ncbi:MAG: hypothetical protein L0J63_07145 [Tetragenococcus koreensis]|nr:hypothetical protein [Tetragenococcus koreensis]
MRIESHNNSGGLAPITNLTNTELINETSLTIERLLKEHFILFGVVLKGFPNKGIKILQVIYPIG